MSVCVNCGGEASEGSMKHPYCSDCWNKIWKGREEQYFELLPYHNIIIKNTKPK